MAGLGLLETGQPGGHEISPLTTQVLACAAEVVPMLLDDATGRPLDVGRTRYPFTPAIRRAIGSGTSTAPSPAARPNPPGATHHLLPYSRGGTTAEGNGALLCGWHHRFVHAHGWTATLIDGHIVWRPPQHIDHDPDHDPRRRPRRRRRRAGWRGVQRTSGVRTRTQSPRHPLAGPPPPPRTTHPRHQLNHEEVTAVSGCSGPWASRRVKLVKHTDRGRCGRVGPCSLHSSPWQLGHGLRRAPYVSRLSATGAASPCSGGERMTDANWLLWLLWVAVLLALPALMLAAAQRSTRLDQGQRDALKRAARRLFLYQCVIFGLSIGAAAVSHHGHREAVNIGGVVLACLALPFIVLRVRTITQRRPQ